MSPTVFFNLEELFAEFGKKISEDITHKLIPSWVSFVVQLSALIIMIIVGFFVAYKPVKKLLQKRADYVENNIRESEVAKAEADKNVTTSQEMIIASKKEAADIVANARMNAENIKREKEEETVLEINKMKALAEEDIENSKEEAKEEIRREMISVALSASEEILKREINEKDNARIVEDFIKEID